MGRPVSTRPAEDVGDADVDVEASGLGDPRFLRAASVLVVVDVFGGGGSKAEDGAAEEGALHAGFERRDGRCLVGALRRRARVDDVTAALPLRHALGDAESDLRDVLPRPGASGVDGDAAVGATGENSVGRDDVEVHGATEGRVETLDDGDAPRLVCGDAPRRVSPARGFLDEDTATRRRRIRAMGYHAADFEGRDEHPLPHRSVGQDALDEVLA